MGYLRSLKLEYCAHTYVHIHIIRTVLCEQVDILISKNQVPQIQGVFYLV